MTPFSPAPPKAPSTRPLVLGALLSLLTAGAAPAAENLLENPGFDTDTSGWELTGDSAPATLSWAPDDAAGDPGSGSLEIRGDSGGEDVRLFQCLGPLPPGSEVRMGGTFRFVEGGLTEHLIFAFLAFQRSSDCSDGFNFASSSGIAVRSRDSWRSVDKDDAIRPDAQGVLLQVVVRPSDESSGPFVAQVDDLFVNAEAPDGGDPDDPPGPDSPEPDPAGWFTDPLYPDFRFNVEISAGETSRLGVREPFCLDETVCVSGAVPGRVEMLLRIVGPKPNGRLWPTLFKASTSRFDVWIERLSSGVMKHYVLEGATPGSSELPGLFDRDGFVP